MNCYCCGKPLRDGNENGWHPACIRRFFGTTVIPQIEIDDSTLMQIARENTQQGITVPGVQKKLSLSLHSEGRIPRLTLVNYPAGYILKPRVAEFECLPEAEQLAMSMADITGISTVPHALLRRGETIAYITKRVDRTFDKAGVKKLAMEDFCQLDLRLTQDKYRGSYERCAKVIDRYSSRAKLDMSELFMRLVFSFIVGNSDMHLKNFSLIETEEASGIYVLSPAYDLLPVNVVMPEDTETFALAMNGKKTNIRKKDFLVYAEACGISETSAEKMIAHVVSLKNIYHELCRTSLLTTKLKDRLIQLIEERCEILGK
ncbi:MAG: HipA domain-containing protein [Lachnospiraceae bacterium]|nr:HipA domain-containing protein [Lachnospiraceae bacterium]